jgi:hypothetical protein
MIQVSFMLQREQSNVMEELPLYYLKVMNLYYYE